MSNVKMPEPSGKAAHIVTDQWDSDWIGSEDAYTEAQLKQYGDDRAREALEMAADTCDSTMYVESDGTVSKYGPMTYANVEIKKCADAIRALTKEIK